MKSISDMNLAEVTLAILSAAVNIPDGMYARAQYLATEELRALLDEPVLESQYDGMTQAQAQAVSDGVDEILHGKPAAQHQGEPVAEVEMAEGDLPHVQLYQDLPDGTKLYAEQPAPVAVVMPARKPQRITDEYARGLNDYDAEHKRLNGVKP